MDSMVTNIKEIIGDVRIGSSLGCSNHALVEFAALRNLGQVRSKVRLLNFRKGRLPTLQRDCQRDPLGDCP